MKNPFSHAAFLSLYFISCCVIAQPQKPPASEFDASVFFTPLNYQDDNLWMALPGISDNSDIQPSGAPSFAGSSLKLADVFYVHPTTYLSNKSWTDPLENGSGSHENDLWMLAYQASIFNKCCDIYAPRYRQASIHAYLLEDPIGKQAIFDVAYQDVKAAFEHFTRTRDKRRPFLLASHSQGTHHALRLIKEEIDTSMIREQLVAGYMLGSTLIPVSDEYVSSLEFIDVCSEPTQFNCFVHWDTASKEGPVINGTGQSVCINPLSWKKDTEMVAQSVHKGALQIKHAFLRNFGAEDSGTGKKIESLGKLHPNLTWAQCKDGVLRVSDLDQTIFLGVPSNGNYHILDFTLFYADIQHNAEVRLRAYLAKTQNIRP